MNKHFNKSLARRHLASACATAFTLFALSAAPALAVDVKAAGQFELDSNALDSPAGTPDDWSALVGTGTGSSESTTHVLADFSSPDYNFVAGGSKDDLNINRWTYHAAKMTPDKDNITNAYAAAYVVDGHLLFYFGADRYAVNGDAQLGFWFFKNPVGLAPMTGSAGKFTGVHHDDDVLVQVNFLNGGKTAEIGVFKWSGGALEEIVEQTVTSNSSVPEVCTPGNLACARTNISGTTASYWPYTPKSGASNVFPFQAFFEGGIDVTALIGGNLCFSTFMAETRSAQSFDSTLKDFVLGPLATCSIGVSKTCNSTRATTDAEYASTGMLWASTYTATLTNSGGAPFPSNSQFSVIDDAGSPSDTSDDIVQSFTGSLASGASHTFPEKTFFTNENGARNTVDALVKVDTNTFTADPFSIDCPRANVTGALSVTKDCNSPAVQLVPSEGKLIAKVNVKGSVCNTSPTGGLTLSVTSIKDVLGTDPEDPAATVRILPGTPFSLAPGDCANYTDSYFPSQGDGSTSPAGDAVFSDSVKATATNPRLDTPVSAVSDAAHCPVCVPPAN